MTRRHPGHARDSDPTGADRTRQAELARLDLLTGLPNCAVFVTASRRQSAWARIGGRRFAFFYLDLDHFKDVNDTLGHPGRRAAARVAKRLERNVRETDTVARFGGDESAVLATEIKEPADAGVLAERAGGLQQAISVGENQMRAAPASASPSTGWMRRTRRCCCPAPTCARPCEGRGPRDLPVLHRIDGYRCTNQGLSGNDLREAIGSPHLLRLPAAGRGLDRPHPWLEALGAGATLRSA